MRCPIIRFFQKKILGYEQDYKLYPIRRKYLNITKICSKQLWESCEMKYHMDSYNHEIWFPGNSSAYCPDKCMGLSIPMDQSLLKRHEIIERKGAN